MKNIKFLLTIFLPMHLLAIALSFNTSVGVNSFYYFLVGYVLIGGLGVGVGLHRWASHRSIKLKSLAEPVVLYLSILACQGHPIWWAALHRGYHHRHADTDKDIHSPVLGKWHAFLGWIISHDPSTVKYKYSIDLIRKKSMIITSKYYELIIWGSWIIAGLIDLNFLLWAILMPTILSFHAEGLVNAFCHNEYGYRNFSTKDKSSNNLLIAFISWGNGWHNNHHHKPSSYDFGKSVSGKKWEIDPCVIFLPFIKK